MDANEVFARQQMAEAMCKSAQPVATNEVEAAAIREAQANLAREKERFWVREPEILKALHVETIADLERILPTLQALNFPGITVHIVPGSRFLGTKDRQTIATLSQNFDRWFEKFNEAAAQLGYAKSAPRVSTSAGRVAAIGGAVLASVLFG